MHDDADTLPYDPNMLAALNDQFLAFVAEQRAEHGEDMGAWPLARTAYYTALSRGIDIRLQANLLHMKRHGWMPTPPPPDDPHDRPDPAAGGP